MVVEYHEAAREEVMAAATWYALRDVSAAARFVAEIERVEDLIAAAPDRWPAHTWGTRRLLLRRFPYGVVYRIESTRVLIVAVVHDHQAPGYWRRRK